MTDRICASTDCDAVLEWEAGRGSHPKFCSDCLAFRVRIQHARASQAWRARNPDYRTPVAAAICQNAECTNERPRINGRRFCDGCRDERRRRSDREIKAKNRQLQPGWERTSRWSRFGITPEFVDVCEACEACGAAEAGGQWGTWHGDHDHACCKRGCRKCFRGLVCMECNTGRIRVLDREPLAVLEHLARFGGDSALARTARFLLKHRQLKLVPGALERIAS